MSITRKLGILVVMMVPGIVGGGFVYAAAGDSYVAVAVYEALLAAGIIGWLVKSVKPAQ